MCFTLMGECVDGPKTACKKHGALLPNIIFKDGRNGRGWPLDLKVCIENTTVLFEIYIQGEVCTHLFSGNVKHRPNNDKIS